jgi:hypothetical protein
VHVLGADVLAVDVAEEAVVRLADDRQRPAADLERHDSLG